MKEDPRILVVDDEEVLANFVAKILSSERDADYNVGVTATGEDAVRMFEEEPFDLLLVDIKLPKMNGIEVLRKVKEIDQNVQVVMITAYASLETAIDALREGAYDYIVKPFEAEQMKSLVKHALERRNLIVQREDLIKSLSDVNDRLADANKKLEEKKALVDKELEDRIGELTRLNELTTNLSSELNLGKLLELTPKLSCEVINSEGGMVCFREGDKLRVKSSSGLEKALPKGRRLSTTQEPFLSVLKEEKPGVATDWKPEEGDGEEVGTLACATLKGVRGEGFGVLCVSRKDGPFSAKNLELLSTVASAAATAFQNAMHVDTLQTSYLQSLLSLLLVQEAKNPDLRGHSERVAELSTKIARKLSISDEEVRMIRFSALLHDLGKVGLRDELLSKKALNQKEEAELRESYSLSEKIIEPIRFLHPAKTIIHHEGEKWDGSGGPDSLAGEKIPIGSRILAVANFYDEAVSGALQGTPVPADEAMNRLKSLSGKTFSPQVVEAAIEVLKEGEKS